MELALKLESFEGPLDLLLHLIDKNKVSIYDIPIVMITEQFLAYVTEMERQDLDDISEFLVMAATLLDIKARMLLPQPEPEAEEAEDPREELVRRLLEYKKYKLLAADMREWEEGSEKRCYRLPDIPEEVAKFRPPVDLDELLGEMTGAKLKSIFDELIRRSGERVDEVHSRFGEIEREAVHIGDRLDYVRERIKGGGHKSFRTLLGEASGKIEIIVTFLAVLELIKTGEIRLTEDSTRDDFYLEDNGL